MGLSASQLKLLADHETVREQSALSAGVGGFDISVNGHTHLRGGAISTEGAAGASRLATQTLTHESVVNKDVALGSSWGVSLSISNKDKDASGNEKGALAGSTLGFARIDSGQTGATASSVGGVLTLSRPDLQATRVGAMATAERAPLEAKRADAQQRLQTLMDNDPGDPVRGPAAPTEAASLRSADVGAGKAGVAAVATTAVSADAAAAPVSDGTEGTSLADGGSPGRTAWLAKVRAVQAEIAKLDGRIAAVNTKVYQGASTLSSSPSGLHQPLLQTFDRTRTTQELKDGVAVTAAFGKAAFKTAGDVAKTQYDNAITACGGPANANNCAEADKWREGGLYKSALHGVVGALSFGQAGGLAALTAEGASPHLRNAILAAGITDNSAAFNVLMLGAKAMVGAGVGATAGAASAFNADANNRQLHSAEKARIRQLANGDIQKEQRLSAAACYLVRCAGEFLVGTEAWEGLTRLERMGATMTAELALLGQQSDTSGAMFTYSYWAGAKDELKQLNNRYNMLAKLSGGLQMVGGSASAVAGGTIVATGLATCAPSAGAGCAAATGGALLMLWGEDQIMAGTRAVASGSPQFTLGARLISEATGISLDAAELWYALPGVATGGSAAIAATAQSKQLAWNWRFATATYADGFNGAAKGVDASSAVMGTPQAQALIREIQASSTGMSYEVASRYAAQAIESGTALPTVRSAQAGETLYKVVPRGGKPSDTSGYWMTAPQADAVSRMSLEQAASMLGLPTEQLLLAKSKGGFDFFSLTLKQGQTATVFESKIAATEQRMFNQGGGAVQTFVPNRSQWTEPVKIDVPQGQRVVAPRTGG